MESLDKTILVTGADGMIGRQVDFGVKLGHKELDITDPASIATAIDKYKPDVILHLAAMTEMLECQADPIRAYELNVIGTFNITKACLERNIKLAYFSSCVVFGQDASHPHTETDVPAPTNVYGRTKLISETIMRELLPAALIVRTGWCFGGGFGVDKKFVKRMYEKLASGQPIDAVADRFGSPTFVPDLLKATQLLIAQDKSGVVHVVNDGIASYFEVAQAINQIGNFNLPINPMPGSTIEPGVVRRGSMEALVSASVKLRPWKEALTEYITDDLAIHGLAYHESTAGQS